MVVKKGKEGGGGSVNLPIDERGLVMWAADAGGARDTQGCRWLSGCGVGAAAAGGGTGSDGDSLCTGL